MEPGSGGAGCFIARFGLCQLCGGDSVVIVKLRGCLSGQDGRCPYPTKDCLNPDGSWWTAVGEQTGKPQSSFTEQEQMMKPEDPPEALKKRKNCLLQGEHLAAEFRSPDYLGGRNQSCNKKAEDEIRQVGHQGIVQGMI